MSNVVPIQPPADDCKEKVKEYYLTTSDIHLVRMDRKFRLPRGTVRAWVDQEGWAAERLLKRENDKKALLARIGDPKEDWIKSLEMTRVLKNELEQKLRTNPGLSVDFLQRVSTTLIKIDSEQFELVERLGL